MKIFHGIENIAGSAGVLARAQRAIGLEARAYCFPSSFQYPVDHLIKDTGRFTISLELLRLILTQSWRFDVFQFYFGSSLTYSALLDIPWLKRFGKKVFFYFCGCDIRDSKAVIAKYEFSACKEHWPMACSANRKKAIALAQKYADGVFVSTPDLLEFVPGSIWLPQPIDLRWFSPLREQALAAAALPPGERRSEFVIAHAPSNRMIKGSDYLERAVADLQAGGYPVKLLLIENMPYEQALQTAAGADLVVDQLLVGAYGAFAVEMMALGKPVICYIRDDIRPHYQANLPIISANPNTIGQVLKELMDQRQRWSEIGRQGMAYTAQVHDSLAVAGQTQRYYQNSQPSP
ncbi:MAG: glycosyltransferase [Anaerolineales bacterium]|nr:glycosyltransferase [Anaerolineales bacterium]